jgi:sec-independent protein translocase protein TatB
MFGLGFTEILLIAVIAILFLGPEKLPDAMVQVAKFMKSAKKAISDAKNSLDEEMKISDLKEEALNYKKQLDDATDELAGFKNIGINPIEDINEAIGDAKKSFTEAAQEAEGSTIATQVEPKQETVTFKKKKKKPKKDKKDKKEESKGGEA